MILGLNTNTSDYILRTEAGVRSIETETRRRAGGYVARIMEMEEDRWLKICLKEETRISILNEAPTVWGKEL